MCGPGPAKSTPPLTSSRLLGLFLTSLSPVHCVRLSRGGTPMAARLRVRTTAEAASRSAKCPGPPGIFRSRSSPGQRRTPTRGVRVKAEVGGVADGRGSAGSAVPTFRDGHRRGASTPFHSSPPRPDDSATGGVGSGGTGDGEVPLNHSAISGSGSLAAKGRAETDLKFRLTHDT